MVKIFVSHSSKNNNIVKKIVEILKRYYSDEQIWVDFEQIEPIDDKIIAKINKCLRESTIFLLMWSKDAHESLWVEKETNSVTSSDYNHIKKFSFKLDDTKLPALDFSYGMHDRMNEDNIEQKTMEFIHRLGGTFGTQIRIYKQRVVEDFKNFKKDVTYNPIIKDFRKFDGYHLYVSQKYNEIKKLNPSKKDPRSGTESTEKLDVLREVTKLLKNNDKNDGKIIPIVGQYGSGKSLLSTYLSFTICEDNDDTIIPIYVPLGSLNYTDPIDSNLVESEKRLINSIYDYIKTE